MDAAGGALELGEYSHGQTTSFFDRLQVRHGPSRRQTRGNCRGEVTHGGGPHLYVAVVATSFMGVELSLAEGETRSRLAFHDVIIEC